jgi:acid phosphatase type 7
MKRALPVFLILAMLAAAFLAYSPRPLPAAPQPAAGEKVVGGPYVVNVGPRSAMLMWVLETGHVSFGADAAKMDKSAALLRAERISLSGLKAGATYYYQSFEGEAGKGSFQTPPAVGASFEFVVYGDTRTRHDVHRGVIQGILKNAKPDFVMHTGDLVADGWDPSLWPIFFDAERDLLRKAAIFPTLGNHDRNSKIYFDLMNAVPYYSFDWGSAHFTVIDTDIGNAGPTQAAKDAFWQEQTRWLEADLRDAQKAGLRFLSGHHPPITAVKNRQGANPHMIALEPMFEKYKLSAAFFGHDHNYQHYLKNGIHYFITGGGGAPLYDVDLPPPGITQKVASTENFVVVRVDGTKVHVEAMKPNGEKLDVTELGQ